ncbi:hypothetical protein [Streptomyces wuyuanensis]|uniref:hypothetical protein n=1 Tax=Streptomyces wuyuanensis TaxID=1196353 RepID=UPI003419C70F
MEQFTASISIEEIFEKETEGKYTREFRWKPDGAWMTGWIIQETQFRCWDYYSIWEAWKVLEGTVVDVHGSPAEAPHCIWSTIWTTPWQMRGAVYWANSEIFNPETFGFEAKYPRGQISHWSSGSTTAIPFETLTIVPVFNERTGGTTLDEIQLRRRSAFEGDTRPLPALRCEPYESLNALAREVEIKGSSIMGEASVAMALQCVHGFLWEIEASAREGCGIRWNHLANLRGCILYQIVRIGKTQRRLMSASPTGGSAAAALDETNQLLRQASWKMEEFLSLGERGAGTVPL